MGLDVFFPQDVKRILIGLASAGHDRGPEYLAALRDVALSFGVVRENGNGRAGAFADPQLVFGGDKGWER
jgi:hypothetical protein